MTDMTNEELAAHWEATANALKRERDEARIALSAAFQRIAAIITERNALAAAIQKAAMSLGSTDEWSDHHSMIGDFEERLSGLQSQCDEARLANIDLAEQLEKAERQIACAPRAENARLREALEIIAKRRQCLDNLMSNQDIAIAALEEES